MTVINDNIFKNGQNLHFKEKIFQLKVIHTREK